MRPDEQFVAGALVRYFGGPSIVSAQDGTDPPDISLSFATHRIGVEVTRLSQVTIKPDGTFGNRAAEDFFGLDLLDDLNSEIGPLLPGGISLQIGLWVPVSNGAKFRRALFRCVREVAPSCQLGMDSERHIEGARVSISTHPEREAHKRIAGFVVNKHSSSDIGLNARLVLERRITAKTERCAHLPKPIWLALFNDYNWLADDESYAVAYGKLNLPHCFERIFLILESGAVSELSG